MIAKTAHLPIACLVVFVAAASSIGAQTYDLGPGTQNKSAQSKDQPLGWGSNIENARLTRAAELALRRGDHALAMSCAQRAAQATPNDPHSWFLLGYAARLNGSFQLSVEAYDRGLRLSPSSLEGVSGLAQAYSQTGRIEDAVRLLKQVESADPERRDEAQLLGDLYMRQADYTSALEWLGKAERIEPSARSELLMAISYQHLKQLDLANRYLDLAQRRAPGNPEVQRSMAEYYREIGHYPEALNALKSIRNPKPDIEAELAYTYQLDGNASESAKHYAQAANALPKDLEFQLSAAQAEVAVGALEKAETFLNRATGIDSTHYRLHAIRGDIDQLQDRIQDAIREDTEALAALPANPAEGQLYTIQLHMNLMDLYSAVKNESAARHQLELSQSAIGAVNVSGRDRVQFLRLKALIEMSAGDLQSALTDANNALSLDRRDRAALQLVGDILMKLGRTQDAIASYTQVLGEDSGNRFALTALGYAFRSEGRDQEAEHYFRQLAQADPTLFIPYLALGDLYTARRDFARAQDSYSKGYTLAPSNAMIVAGGMNAANEAHNFGLAEIWLNRAKGDMEKDPHLLREKERYLSFMGRYRESAAVGREAIQSLPRDRDVVVYLGYDLLHLEKYDELLALTSQYLAILPHEPDIPLLEGYVHKHQREFEAARQDFTEALERDPGVVTAYVNRGYVLNDLHRSAESAADFEAALKREPNDGEAHLGLAYASLELNRPHIALTEAAVAEQRLGDSKDIHVIRATAYGLQDMLPRAADEYRVALRLGPDDGTLRLGLGNILLTMRRYHEAIREFEKAETLSPDNEYILASLARSHALLHERDEALRYVQLAEQHLHNQTDQERNSPSVESAVLLSTGETLNILGDSKAAMERFQRALTMPGANRASVRLAIARIMAQQGHGEDAERQIALTVMEAEAGETVPPNGSQFLAAADIFRTMHDYQLSQSFLLRAKSAGAPDEQVRIGLANNYLALGDTSRAHAEISAVSAAADRSPDYQFYLTQANMFRQEHHDELALTSFAQAANAGGEDQTAEQSLLLAGADEGLRLTPQVSLLSDASVEPLFEDTTVYVLDSKLDAPFAVPSSDTALLPPPRSSLETQGTSAFHLHLNHLPTSSGFFQVRNSQGQISVPSTNSIVSRNTTDYVLNFGLNPTLVLGNNVLTFNSGIQGTLRRDSESPIEMNQNLFRIFTYLSTNSLFNAVAVSGFVVREGGPFVESNLHSRALTGALDFRVGAPWGKTALLAGWGANDQHFSPISFEDYITSSYLGLERQFIDRFNIRAEAEDIRAWRVVGTRSGIAQSLRPAGTVDFAPKHNWALQASMAYSNNRSFHVYDAVQSGFSISYAKPFQRRFRDDSENVVLQYPIQFSAGFQQDTFFNFSGGRGEQLRPYFRITLF